VQDGYKKKTKLNALGASNIKFTHVALKNMLQNQEFSTTGMNSRM
jgi:hypothetical protein